MGVVNGLVVFLIVWWLVIFTMLPIGVRSQQEEADIVEGTEPGAPVAPMLLKKAWWTTVITSGIWIVYYLAAGEGGLDGRAGIAGQDQVGVGQHAMLVEQAQRQRAAAHDGRNLVGQLRRLGRILSHIDRIGRAVGRVGAVAFMMEQQHAFARFGVVQRDAAGKAGLGGDGLADNAAGGEFRVRQTEQGAEGVRRQAGDAKTHLGHSLV